MAAIRSVFLGTSVFALPALASAVEATDVVAVVTKPDRPGDRGLPADRPVAERARLLGLPILQPEKFKDEAFQEHWATLAPELLVVASYGKIIPNSLLESARFGGINVHGSLLPRWRGAAPIHAAVLAGDAELGITIMQMDAGMDTGPVLYPARLARSAARLKDLPERFSDLVVEFAELGGDALSTVLHALGTGKQFHPHPQDNSLATMAPKVGKDAGSVSLAAHGASEIARAVYVYAEWPGVRTSLAGREVELTAVREIPGFDTAATVPGGILGRLGTAAVVATASGALAIQSVRPPGRKEMEGASFLNGIPELGRIPKLAAAGDW